MFEQRSRGKKTVFFLLIVVLVVVLDQVTKAGAKYYLDDGSVTKVLIPHVMDLRIVQNTGAAFSLGEGAGPLFVVIAVLVVSFFLYTVWNMPELPVNLVVSLGCVAGGGVGNMIDRIFDGSVTDFLAPTFINFPVFNVADMFVTVGVVFCLYGYIQWSKKTESKELS